MQPACWIARIWIHTFGFQSHALATQSQGRGEEKRAIMSENRPRKVSTMGTKPNAEHSGSQGKGKDLGLQSSSLAFKRSTWEGKDFLTFSKPWVMKEIWWIKSENKDYWKTPERGDALYVCNNFNALVAQSMQGSAHLAGTYPQDGGVEGIQTPLLSMSVQ